jgi:hypothetical protein
MGFLIILEGTTEKGIVRKELLYRIIEFITADIMYLTRTLQQFTNNVN